MIFLYLRLPYRRQLRLTDPASLFRLDRAVEERCRELGGRAKWMEERVLLSFEEGRGCALLRAAEALSALGKTLGELGPALHGYSLLLERSEAELLDVLERLDRLWLGIPADGSWATLEAAEFAASFVLCGEAAGELRPVRGFSFDSPLLPPDWAAPGPESSTVERLAAELRARSEEPGPRRLFLVSGPRESTRTALRAALEDLGGAWKGALFLGPGSPGSPLAPFLPLAPAGAGGEGENLAFRLVASSLCRRRHGPPLLAAFSRLLLRCLEGEAGEALPPLLILEDLDLYAPEALSVLEFLLAAAEGGRSLRPLIVATALEAPRGLRQDSRGLFRVPPLPPSAIAEAAKEGAKALGELGLAPSLASLARGEAFRLRLALRVAAAGGETALAGGRLEGEELLSLALDSLPGEYAGWYRALALAEDLLDEAAFDEFLEAAGYSPGIRGRIAGAFAALGLVLEGPRPRLARPELRAWLEVARPYDGAVDRAFAAELRSLHERKLVLPSLAFHRRLVEASPEERGRIPLFLDALAADMAAGASLEREEVLAPGPAFELCIPLFRSWAAGSAEEAREALEAFSAAAGREPPSSLAQLLLSLARSIANLCRGEGKVEAAQIRSAIIRLHELGALRAEAKAQRLLGLLALSSAQVAEGLDYLSNAEEIASAIPDDLESFFASFAAAGASFALGDLKRTGTWLERAGNRAAAAFRPDWELGVSFARARLDFELGRYGKAEEGFEDIAEAAAALGAEAPERRARIWAGRAAAWSGMGSRTRTRLGPWPEDAEALWFLAELASWEGDWQEATRLADRALERLPVRAWRPLDALSWDSGFDLLEGPCLGSWASSPYLADQLGAFADFVHAMAEGEPERVASLAARSREGRLAPLHPQAHLYDWFAFIACESMENSPFDPGTLLSRAWKALQTRTLRMEEAAIKNQFLEGNRWNREIVAAARARRLI